MKYKVLKEFILNGIVQKFNSIIELNYEQANLKSIQLNIEKVVDNIVPLDDSILGNLKRGEILTSEQKEKLTKENIIETVEAQRLATEHRSRDVEEGKGEPVIKTIADTLKDKLVNEEFEKKIE